MIGFERQVTWLLLTISLLDGSLHDYLAMESPIDTTFNKWVWKWEKSPC